MTLITPSTLLAVQSYPTPAPAGQKGPAAAFQPIDAGELVTRPQAETDAPRPRRTEQPATEQPAVTVAAPSPDTRVPLPAGSTLDITI